MRWHKYIHTHRNTYAIIPNIISSSLPGHSFFNHDIGFFMTETHLFYDAKIWSRRQMARTGLESPYMGRNFPAAFRKYFVLWVFQKLSIHISCLTALITSPFPKQRKKVG